MNCKNCNKSLPDNARFCDNCGTAVDTQQANNQNQAYTQAPFNVAQDAPNQQGNNYCENQPNPTFSAQNLYFVVKNKLDDAKTFAIISLVIGLIASPFIGLIFAIIGFTKLNNIPLYTNLHPNAIAELNNQKDGVRKLCILGIVIPIIIWVVLIIAITLIIASTIGIASGLYSYF